MNNVNQLIKSMLRRPLAAMVLIAFFLVQVQTVIHAADIEAHQDDTACHLCSLSERVDTAPLSNYFPFEYVSASPEIVIKLEAVFIVFRSAQLLRSRAPPYAI